MARWVPSRSAAIGGRFQLVITKLVDGGAAVDVTTVRGVATQLTSYSSADPFGDSTATFTFPSISAFDDLDAPDLALWLAYYANVDLYWVPAVLPVDDRYDDLAAILNPLTNTANLVSPAYLRDSAGRNTISNRIKVWEGFVASLDFTTGPSGVNLVIECQGALFQLDHYLQKPFYPPRPWPLELLIADVFSHTRKPHLRTQPLLTVWPDGWTKKVPKYTGASANVYAPVARPGTKWTGLSSRNTGSWEHALTGFVQDQLVNMITDNTTGTTPGNQFTVMMNRATPTDPHGRQPVLMVRDRFRAPDFSIWVGTPGLDLELSGDSTQSENIVFGSGTGLDGETWRNAVISDDGSRTDYLPLAASRRVYPVGDKGYTPKAFASEAYVTFAGFEQLDATTVAEQQLTRDQSPGWSGTITLATDPSLSMPRWLIQAGWTVLLKGFAGTGAEGMPFHIASVEADPMGGTVVLTVDTRYRDLLTVAESQQRTRDPLNPVRMLQVNKTSVMVEDIQAPWDYTAGSGFVPKACKAFYQYKPSNVLFPYTAWSTKHSAVISGYPSWYVKVNAASSDSKKRWSGAVPILTSEKGAIARSEFYVTDVYGRLLKIPFHVSIYYLDVTVEAMPNLDGQYSPYIDNAFETTNPATGQPWPSGSNLPGDPSMIIGWGNRANGVYNRAGFSPGSESQGDGPTGQLFDDTVWTFDNTTNQPDYDRNAAAGVKQDARAITLYAMFYCENYDEPVYFQGRLFRQNPGTS